MNFREIFSIQWCKDDIKNSISNLLLLLKSFSFKGGVGLELSRFYHDFSKILKLKFSYRTYCEPSKNI